MKFASLFRYAKDSNNFVNFKYFPDIFLQNGVVSSLLESTSTPLYLAFGAILKSRYARLNAVLKRTWGRKSIIAFSLKTNYSIGGFKFDKKRSNWIEVVSAEEYDLAKKLRYRKDRIIYNGPYKSETSLQEAFVNDSLVHIDNWTEIYKIIKLTKKIQGKPLVGIRLQVNLEGRSYSRFGFSIENNQAEEAILKLIRLAKLKIASMHIHLGTDVDTVDIYREATEKIARFIKYMTAKYKLNLRYLDFGGGFPSHGLKPYSKKNWQPAEIEKYVEVVVSELNKGLKKTQKPYLIFEPGRYLVDDAVLLISKVINKKAADHKQCLTTDAANTMLPLKYYRPQIIKAVDDNFRIIEGGLKRTIIYGATCQEDDVLFDGLFPEVKVGQYLVYFCVGAYNQSMGSDFIFKKPKTIFI